MVTVVVSGRLVVVGHRISLVPGKQTIGVKTEGTDGVELVRRAADVVVVGQRGSFVTPGIQTNGMNVVVGDGVVVCGTVMTAGDVGRVVVVGHRISLDPGRH